MNRVYTKTYDAPKFNTNEIMRYAGVLEPLDEVLKLLRECILEISPKLTYKVCWAQFPLSFCDGFVDMSFAKIESLDLRRLFEGCSEVLVFAATVGIEIDRMIARYGHLSPAKALMFQAIGAERIESLCNLFCRDIKEQQMLLKRGITPRFSPGYGDVPLDMQRDIFMALDPQRKIGLTLNSTMLMSPSKSVTAILGISDNINCNTKSYGCAVCKKTDCEYRRKNESN